MIRTLVRTGISITVLLGAFTVTSEAQSLFSFTNASPTFVLPQSGTVHYYLDGTITLGPTALANRAILTQPYDDLTDLINPTAAFSTDLVNWHNANASTPGASFTGHIVDITVSASDPAGLYDKTSGSSAAPTVFFSDDQSNSITRPYSFTLSAATPEPGGIALLAGAGAATFAALRRRRRTRTR